jgi:hypothetical protein
MEWKFNLYTFIRPNQEQLLKMLKFHILTIDSIVICQTHAGYLRTFVHRMHPGISYNRTCERTTLVNDR